MDIDGRDGSAVKEGDDIPYVPSPDFESRFKHPDILFRIKVLSKWDDAVEFQTYSVEFPVISRQVLRFWGTFFDEVFGNKPNP